MEEALWFLPQIKHINIVIITGNPLGLAGQQAYQHLENNLQETLSAVIINDTIISEMQPYLKEKKESHRALSNFPYPNPIKLMSRENQKEIKGEYLNAEMMH